MKVTAGTPSPAVIKYAALTPAPVPRASRTGRTPGTGDNKSQNTLCAYEDPGSQRWQVTSQPHQEAGSRRYTEDTALYVRHSRLGFPPVRWCQVLVVGL